MREKYQAALEMVWREPDNCPICGSTAWNLGDLVDVPVRHVEPPEHLWDVTAKRAYVYAPVTCLYCGYTMFFHTGVLDVRTTEEVKAVPPLHAPGESQ